MNKYLNAGKSALENIDSFKKLFIVIGNESCDLDSAASALIYGYYLHSEQLSKPLIPIISVLNIQENEFPLRTETKYFFNKLNIDSTKLVFRNNINLEKLAKENKLQLVLVDHHVLPAQDKNLESSVIEVIDHRPIDKNSNWKNVIINIKNVGSCSSLIADVLFNKKSNIIRDVAKLLHGTIVLDTINFNKKANRFTQLDLDMVSKIEQNFNIDYTREEIFNELTSAKNNVSTLTPFQILHRDMKIINNVPIPGLPMLVIDFLKLDGAVDSLKAFCDSKKCKVIVLMGIVTINKVVSRDVGVYFSQKCELSTDLVNCLRNNTELQLTEVSHNVSNLVLFSQANVTASRKHIVPIITSVITNCKVSYTL